MAKAQHPAYSRIWRGEDKNAEGRKLAGNQPAGMEAS